MAVTQEERRAMQAEQLVYHLDTILGLINLSWVASWRVDDVERPKTLDPRNTIISMICLYCFKFCLTKCCVLLDAYREVLI